MNRSILLAGCGLMAVSAPAFAQDEAAASDDNVIIVTAQNRAQNVQDVPIAMDVLTGEDIVNSGFSDANDLGKLSPAVQVNQDQGTVKITVRGIGTTSNDEAQDTSVVVNVDGEYINRPNVLSVALFDMERVEVLRGPQGTLYGRNSTGGAINFISRKPGKDFGFNGSATYGNYDTVKVDAGVDVPVGTDVGIRLAGFYDSHDGYVKHPAGWGFGPFPAFAGGRSDDNESYGGRATIAWDSPSGFSGDVQAEYAQRKFTPQAFAAGDLNAPGNGPTGPGCNHPGYEQVATAYAETLCIPSHTNFLEGIDRGEYASPGFGLGLIKQDTWAVRGRLAYEISPEATITYTGGYREFSGDPDSFVTLPIAYQSFSYLDEIKTQSHELRLNGEIGNGIIYQVGGFYFKENQDVINEFVVPVNLGLSYFERFVRSKSWSAFGQVEFPITDQLTAVGGLRYTDNTRSAIYNNATPFGMGPPDPLLFGAPPARQNFDDFLYGVSLPLGSKDNKVTWLAGLNFKPSPDTLVYAKASTGFKGGGFDSVGTYEPETNTAYEVGVKQNFGSSGQHHINFSGFYYDYKGLQVSVLLDTTVGGQTFNAGAATIWGLEAEGAFQLGDNTTFDFSVNYLDTKYDELLAQFNVFCVGCDLNGIGDLDPGTPGVQQPNFAGNRAPFSPKWIVTAGLEHRFELGGAGSLTARANTTIKSSYFTDFYNYDDGKQGSFTQSDASLTWAPENERFSVMAFVRNIENERPLTYGSFISAGPDDIFNWQFGQPRTYGVRVGVDF